MRFLLTLLVIWGLAPGSLHAQRAVPQATDVHARIETDRARYRLGDSIAVRVSLVNMSASEVAFVPLPPWYMVYLVIAREDGKVVERGTFGGGGGTTGQPTFLRSHETRTWDWQGHQWLSLEHWGYRLTEPGRYTVVGIPQIAGPNFKADAVTPRSNKVTITVVP